MHGKNQKTDLVYFYIYLVETFALILNSKIVPEAFLVKVIDTKKNILRTPFSCRFV